MIASPMSASSWTVWAGIGSELMRYFDKLTNDPNFVWIFALLVGVLALFIITRGKWR